MATFTQKGQSGLERRIGPWQATAINMTQMCGIGPFLTIPLMVTAMNGPQAMFGWVIGAIIVLADGLIWAELGAAMPGAGGTYIYLREAFQYRTGRLMPFLFVWTAVLFIPLIMSTGVIGLVQYLGVLWPAVVDDTGAVNTFGHVVGVVITALVVVLLYRKIGDITKVTTVFFGVMLVSILAVIVAAYTHFSAALAFDFTPGAFAGGGAFWTGLGAGLVIAVYDYLGYNTSAYLGGEVSEPGKTLPRSIIVSIVAIMALYLLLQIGILGAVPWQDVAKSFSVATLAVQTSWGAGVANVVTALIVVTAFASVFAGLLGGSRVPYEAARDKLFLPVFAKLHPKGHFPTAGLLVMGVITAIASLFPLTVVINALTAVIVLVQSVAQIAALVVLRRRQPNLERPYKMWLYPVPLVIAFVGWAFLYYSTDSLSQILSVAWVIVGVAAFLIWARAEQVWPFGPKEINEEYLTTSTSAE
ncbi:APC family permease [Kutzneria buriramensis]|uniref:Amino acid transporter n=1 Tax=Kutzneria buriramensis TaxID=1045776 RepID=A0A3E0HAI2_9PSEU|nr:APC family permease [Kutzneria buriramensis]REH40971.1 amino acid transporter [Kutzneria buriramensis]